jgi:class 3 adenylate cyclase
VGTTRGEASRNVAEIVGYEVQIRQGQNPWQTVERFGPDDQAEAKRSLDRLRLENGATAARLSEERVDAQGFFRTRTLGLRSAAPPAGAPERPARGGADRAGRAAAKQAAADAAATGRLPDTGRTSERGRFSDAGRTPRAGRLAGPAPRRAPPAQQAARPGSRFSITDLLGFLFTPIRDAAAQAAAGGGALALPPPPQPVGRRGDLPVYADETGMPTVDLFVSDAIVREFHTFVDALDGLESAQPARNNPRFVQGISLFSIGVLFSIEEHIDIFSERGKTVVHACLSRFLELVDTVNHFLEALERYLKEAESATWIRAGSRCFRYYRETDLQNLNREFGEAFGVYDALEQRLGGRVKVGILFTDIVDSTALTGELGDTLAQAVVDHHDAMVEGIARKFGGRKVKHLGDGLMLCFGSAQAMAGCMTSIIDTMKGFVQRPEVPVYRIRCGGHFGEAIHKGDDFFGSTVQLAARVAGSAGPNEARLCATVVDPDNPAFRRFQDCGAATLKGFAEPRVLARYR